MSCLGAFTATKTFWYTAGATTPKPPSPRTLPGKSSTSSLAISHCSALPMARISSNDACSRLRLKAISLLDIPGCDKPANALADSSDPRSSPLEGGRPTVWDSWNSAWQRICFSTRSPTNSVRSLLSTARFPIPASIVSPKSPKTLKGTMWGHGLPSSCTATG
ncbi:unnamed protein product [Prorocentrum cordatum]|uniref:Uncharacterized protein n=1 Tax=Prorocentrum cordatum TaxID=2364126 RepID=A0ABN9X329_9DINO|nr:unnamed protein product [Polarella glacialis]